MENYIVIDSVKTCYNVVGSGFNVVLLHGWGANKEIFKNLQSKLAYTHRTYSLDIPGFGKSDQPKSVWGTLEYSIFLRKFLERLAISNPILIAHSFGGRIVIQTCSRGYHAEKIVLIASAGIKPIRSIKYYIKIYGYKIIKHTIKILFVGNYSNSLISLLRKKIGSQDYKNANLHMKKILSKVVNEDMTSILHKIGAPTLLVWGNWDKATPLRDAKIMEKHIPNSKLIVIPNSSHYVFLERPYTFFSIVKSFIA